MKPDSATLGYPGETSVPMDGDHHTSKHSNLSVVFV